MGQDIVAYRAQLAEQAKQYAEQEQSNGGTFLSVRGGTLSLGDEAMPGNQACVIVLDSVKENTFYQGVYDADNPAPPVCYGFGRGLEEFGPHPSMQADLSYFKPQSDVCSSCPQNVFGTAAVGKGKACQNRRRLAVIPAGFYSPKRGSRDFDLDVFTEQQHFRTADIVFLKLPVGSVKNWSKYVTQIESTLHTAPHGVITRVSVEPDAKTQYQVHFEMLSEVTDDILGIVMDRHDEALRAVIQGYSPPSADKPTAQAGSLRGLRR